MNQKLEIKNCKCGKKPCVKRNKKIKSVFVNDDFTKIFCNNKNCDQKAVVSFIGYESAVMEWNRSV